MESVESVESKFTKPQAYKSLNSSSIQELNSNHPSQEQELIQLVKDDLNYLYNEICQRLGNLTSLL
jgi:hypothetical protein